MNHNKKTLLVHLGPPKTGTTSLQYWLQNNENNHFYYLGIKPSRFDKDKNVGAHLFYRYVQRKVELETFLNEINKLTNSKLILISEEMLVHGNDWKNNLKMISKLQNYYNIKISYCYRDLTKVAPSNYAECHSNLDEELKNSFSKFINSERMQAYRLPILKKTLEELDLNYQLFCFNELVNSQLTLNKIFNLNCNESIFNKIISLDIKNKTKKKVDYYNAKLKTKAQMQFEDKIRRFSTKYLGKDLSPYFYKSYRIYIKPSKQLEKLAEDNNTFWNNYKNE